MPEDHIAGLMQAIEDRDQAKMQRHIAGLGYEILNGLRRIADALEKTADKAA